MLRFWCRGSNWWVRTLIWHVHMEKNQNIALCIEIKIIIKKHVPRTTSKGIQSLGFSEPADLTPHPVACSAYSSSLSFHGIWVCFTAVLRWGHSAPLRLLSLCAVYLRRWISVRDSPRLSSCRVESRAKRGKVLSSFSQVSSSRLGTTSHTLYKEPVLLFPDMLTTPPWTYMQPACRRATDERNQRKN